MALAELLRRFFTLKPHQLKLRPSKIEKLSQQKILFLVMPLLRVAGVPIPQYSRRR